MDGQLFLYEYILAKHKLSFSLGDAHYKLYISNVIDALASKGIKMIKPMTISPDELGGLDWNISKNLEHEQMLIPEDSIMFKNPDDTYNLRFSSYKKKQTHDEEATTSGLEKFLEQ